MRTITIYTLFVLLLFNCKGEALQNPIIPKDKMVKLMAEVHLIELHYQKNIGSDINQKTLDEELNTVFKRFHTDKKTYRKSFDFYMQNPTVYMELNSMVIQELKEQMNRIK
jgi:hypothetical protein